MLEVNVEADRRASILRLRNGIIYASPARLIARLIRARLTVEHARARAVECSSRASMSTDYWYVFSVVLGIGGIYTVTGAAALH